MPPSKPSRANLSTSCYMTEGNNHLLGFSHPPGPGKNTFTGKRETRRGRHTQMQGLGPRSAGTRPAAPARCFLHQVCTSLTSTQRPGQMKLLEVTGSPWGILAF